MHDRLLRPAMVGVSKKTTETEANKDLISDEDNKEKNLEN